jgi:hypothetical protein
MRSGELLFLAQYLPSLGQRLNPPAVKIRRTHVDRVSGDRMATQEVTLASVHQAVKRFLPEGATPDLYSWIQPTSFQSTSLTDIAYTYIVTGIANITTEALGTNEYILWFLLPRDNSGTLFDLALPNTSAAAILFPSGVYVAQAGGTGGIESWQIQNFSVLTGFGPGSDNALVFCQFLTTGLQGATQLMSMGFQVTIAVQ